MKRNHSMEKKQAFEGGATRSAKLERFDLVPPEAHQAAARRFGLGAIKHGEGNWKKGGVAFIKATLNHLEAHLCSLKESPPDHNDDDIGAMLWNAMALAWFRERRPTEYAQALKELREGLAE